MLDGFHVTSPWSDSRSLVASWTWKQHTNLQFFEKAYLFYYSPLDEGFERTEVITRPITSYVLRQLRPETVYFVCLRVHHRRRANNLPTSKSLALPTTTLTTTTTMATAHDSLSSWPTRQLPSPISPDKYAYDVRCAQATTQNWHLSALIGGLLGVVFALIIGFLLLFVLRRRRWWPGSSGGWGKQATEHSFMGNSCSSHSSLQRRGRSSDSRRRRSFRSRLCTTRSSSSRGEFSEHLREEDEDDDEDDEVIAEDDEEDTEIDTGCKSSVRSQTGIYGGSGGTTASSNRHSSVCSSVDTREESSFVAHISRLSVNGGQVRRSREMSKRPFNNLETVNNSNINNGKVVPEVTSKISTPPAESDENLIKNSIFAPPLLPVSITSLQSPQPVGNTSCPATTTVTPVSFKGPPRITIRQLDDTCDPGECQTPAPLADPQPVNLTAPILPCPMEKLIFPAIWLESPKIETALPETPYAFDEEEEDENEMMPNTEQIDLDFEPSLSLSDAASRSSSARHTYDDDGEECDDSDDYSYANTDSEVKKHPSIYMEFIETI